MQLIVLSLTVRDCLHASIYLTYFGAVCHARNLAQFLEISM